MRRPRRARTRPHRLLVALAALLAVVFSPGLPMPFKETAKGLRRRPAW
jgi:hypothetical protein